MIDIEWSKNDIENLITTSTKGKYDFDIAHILICKKIELIACYIIGQMQSLRAPIR